MLKSREWVANEILETAQSQNSSFPFLFDIVLGLGTWTRSCQLKFCGTLPGSDMRTKMKQNTFCIDPIFQITLLNPILASVIN